MKVTQIFLSGHAVDFYDREVITASMGSFFKVPFAFIDSNENFSDILSYLRARYKDLQVIATSLQTENLLQDNDFNKPTLLLIANEKYGFNKFYKEIADKHVKYRYECRH